MHADRPPIPGVARLRAGIRRSDVALVAVVVAVNVAGVAAELAESPYPAPIPAGAYALAVLAGLLVLPRRTVPGWTAVAVTVVCAAYHLLGYPGYGPGTALFAVAYALTGYGSGRSGLVRAAAVIAVNSGIVLAPPHSAFGNLWAVLGPATGMIAAAAFGEAARARAVAVAEQLRRVRQTAEEDVRRRITDERLTIARELHDVLAHTITVIGVQAAAGGEAVDRSPAEAKAAFDTIRGATKEAMSELRGTLKLLRSNANPSTAEPLPAEPQPRLADLPRLVDQASQAGLRADVVTTGDPTGLPLAVELAAYRIVQEALTNVIRHAAARTVHLRLDYRPDAVHLDITDDGVGATEPATTGHGLIGMRERARAVGGTLSAGAPDTGARGFQVRAELPTGAV